MIIALLFIMWASGAFLVYHLVYDDSAFDAVIVAILWWVFIPLALVVTFFEALRDRLRYGRKH